MCYLMAKRNQTKSPPTCSPIITHIHSNPPVTTIVTIVTQPKHISTSLPQITRSQSVHVSPTHVVDDSQFQQLIKKLNQLIAKTQSWLERSREAHERLVVILNEA